MAKPIPNYRASIYSTGQATSYTTAPTWTPSAGSLLIAFVENSLASSPGDPSSVTGHGVTYSKLTLGTSTLGTTHKISVWIADAGTSPTATAVTATFGGNQTGCSIIEYELTGVDLTGGVAASIVQNPTSSGTGTSGSITVGAAGNSQNIQLACFAHQANEGTTPRTNWTEPVGSDGNFNAPATGVEAQYRTDAFETTASASWATSSAWIGVALEIKAALAQMAVGVLALAGVAPALGFALIMSAGALSLSGPSANVFSGQLVPTGTLTLAGNAPAQKFLGPDTGAIAFTGQAPTLLIRAVTITPPAGSLALSGTTPILILAGSPSPGTGALLLEGQQPARVLGGQTAFVPPGAALTFTGYAPAHSFLGPAEGSLALNGPAPTASVASSSTTAVSPGTGALVLASDDIEVQFLGPDVGTLALTGETPLAINTPGANALRLPPVGTLTLSGIAPAANVRGPVIPATGTLSLSGTTPNLFVTSTGLVPTASLSLSGTTPTVFLFGPLFPGTATLNLAGQTPSVTVAPTTFPSVSTLTLSGQVPVALLALHTTHGTATLTLATNAPFLVYGGIAQPGTGRLTITGSAPSIVPLQYQLATGTLTLTGEQPALFGSTTGPFSNFITWAASTTLTTWTPPSPTMTTWGAN